MGAFLYEPINVYKPVAPNIGIVDGPFDVVVKKHRITTVTVSILDRPPRCQCRTIPDQAARASRTCIG